MAEQEITIPVGGMSCDHCVRRVTQALTAVPGVVEAHVDLASAQARVRFISGETQVADLEAAVIKAGYQVV